MHSQHVFGEVQIPAVALWKSCRSLSHTQRSRLLATAGQEMAQGKHNFQDNSVQQGLPGG